jgi:CelD/BcsL family acetyltransferase involved in cellulose biosynthesis
MTATVLQERRVLWIEQPEALWTLHAEWQALACRTDAEVYLRPDWVSTWWDHFGTDRTLACLTIREGERLIGLLPFCVERIWAGPVPVRIARLAGTDTHCIVSRLPLEVDVTAMALYEALRHLLTSQGCHAVSFTPVSDLAIHLPVLRDIIGGKQPGLALHEERDGSHVIFDLPGDFPTWLARLSKKRRSQFQRDLRALQAQYAMQETEIVPNGVAIAKFVEFHNQQWQAVGRGGHFSDWPGSEAFYRDLADRPAVEPPMRLYALTGTTGPLATQFSLIGGSTAQWRLPARCLDPEAERLSIGKVGLLRMIEAMIGHGIVRIEAGRGDYDYKLSYGGQSIAVWRFLVFRNKRRDKLRLQWLLVWGDLLHLFYYRIWFMKLAPKLRKHFGLAPRPLWCGWIRTRL